MIKVLKLKIVDEYEKVYKIRRKNNIKILNYEEYLKFFITIYKKDKVYIENSEIKSKDYLVVDLTSPFSIMKNFEYEKEAILYDYINTCYTEVSEEEKIEIHNKLTQIIKKLEINTELNIKLDLEENIIKYIKQNLTIENNINNISESINKIIKKNIEFNPKVTYIIFYNSNIIDINIEEDKIYLFDVNQNKEIKEYNMIISKEVDEFIYDLLISQIKNIWPIEYNEGEIEELLNEYFKFYSNETKIVPKDEKILIISKIMNNLYKLNKKIEYYPSIKNNAISCYIDNI